MAEDPEEIAGDVTHISGIVVHTPADRAAEVAEAIDALEGAEVAGREGGKLVVVLEADDEGALGDLFSGIQLMDHVYSAALVSHYRDEPDDPEEGQCS